MSDESSRWCEHSWGLGAQMVRAAKLQQAQEAVSKRINDEIEKMMNQNLGETK